jgi:hypothetical protein
LDVWLIFVSLLKFSMGLNIGWEVCGELADLRLEIIVSQRRQLRGRIFSEREESVFSGIGRIIDFFFSL